MSDTTKDPLEGWRITAFPLDWDPDNPDAPVRTVQVGGRATYPERFLLGIQTPEMIEEAEQTGVIVSLTADPTGVQVKLVYGFGPRWLEYLGPIVAAFPPDQWKKRAMRDIIDFLVLDDVRDDLSSKAAELPVLDERESPTVASTTGPSGQRRRKITIDHLREVAKVYADAQTVGDPPTRAVQYHFDVSHSTAAKWVGKARSEGLLRTLD